MTTVDVRCPQCGSSSIAANDHVEAVARIDGFTIDPKGELHPEFNGGSEVNWDTQAPIDADRPYICLDCRKNLSPYDIAPSLARPAALTPERRKAMIEKLCADIVEGASRPSLTLWDMAEKGFTGFAQRTDAELTEAYETAFGDECEA